MKFFSRIFVAVLITIGMFSCNVIDITKKRYSNGYYISSSSNRKVEAQNNIVKEGKHDLIAESKVEKIIETTSTTNVTTTAAITQETVSDTNTADTAKAIHKKKNRSSIQDKPLFAIKSSKFALGLVQMQERKLIDKEAQHNKAASDVDLVLLVILAILLPPLAVFLKRGLDTMFWISLLLTLLFWFPGVIFALLIVLDAI